MDDYLRSVKLARIREEVGEQNLQDLPLLATANRRPAVAAVLHDEEPAN